jgi:hypothetical protein
MTITVRNVTMLLALVHALFAQDTQSAFVRDAEKPYVYVAFDHVGPREPVTSGETPQGLWLRVVNNCRIPIELRTFDLGTRDPGVAINYDVIAVGGIIDERPPGRQPRGYSSDTGSVAVIAPGGTLLFSVPRDHVTKWWYLQTRFDFAIPLPRSGTHPFGTVAFFWEDIPVKYRNPAAR